MGHLQGNLFCGAPRESIIENLAEVHPKRFIPTKSPAKGTKLVDFFPSPQLLVLFIFYSTSSFQRSLGTREGEGGEG